MKRFIALVLVLVVLLAMVGCSPNTDLGEKRFYTYEELEAMPADELWDLFIENSLVINDELKESFTEEQLQALLKEGFHYWHTGVCPMSWTPYMDFADQVKTVYDKITIPQE